MQLAQLVLTVQSQDLLARLDPQDPPDLLVQTETMVEPAQQDLLVRQDPQDRQAQTARLQDQPDLPALQDRLALRVRLAQRAIHSVVALLLVM